ncbi:uncharacterized protein LOC126795875 [Argentina anserina]|uniref:uncharacterized protein LOC126795875 n=1 Tax=Argentina anserina TaxID=57926 RepID=UPI00217650A3|nr:uncharacterized protein LOC126795875 [Potentilla anserina]
MERIWFLREKKKCSNRGRWMDVDVNWHRVTGRKHTRNVLSFLKNHGFSKTHIEGVVQNLPRILCSILDTIKPKIKIFQDLGFSDSDIPDIISCDPWILWHSANNKLSPALLVFKRILGSNAQVETWEQKIKLFRSLGFSSDKKKSLGFSEKDVFALLRRSPLVLRISEKKLKE